MAGVAWTTVIFVTVGNILHLQGYLNSTRNRNLNVNNIPAMNYLYGSKFKTRAVEEFRVGIPTVYVPGAAPI